MNPESRKTIAQAVIGMFVVVVSFVASTIVCEFFIPGTMNRYLTPCGEWLVGAVIFFVSLTLWKIARWKTAALFLVSGFIVGSVVLVFLFLGGGASVVASGFAYAHWGMLADLILVWRHTALPVLCAAMCLFVLRSAAKAFHRAENIAGGAN